MDSVYRLQYDNTFKASWGLSIYSHLGQRDNNTICNIRSTKGRCHDVFHCAPHQKLTLHLWEPLWAMLHISLKNRQKSHNLSQNDKFFYLCTKQFKLQCCSSKTLVWCKQNSKHIINKSANSIKATAMPPLMSDNTLYKMSMSQC